MLPWNDSVFIASASNFAVGGTLLVALLFAVEYYAARWSARVALVTAVLLGIAALVAGAGLAWWDLAIPGSLLSCAALLSLAVRTSHFQAMLRFATRPAVLGALMLAVCLGVSGYVRIAAKYSANVFEETLVVGSEFHVIDGLVALTDLGEPMPLIAYDEQASLESAERAYLGAQQYEHQIIRLAAPSADCNCHGWVYAGGRYAIQSRFIPELLADNGYVEVEQPRADDLVIYRGASGLVEHTGLVRLVGNSGLILVESKWGPLGVYLHPVAAQPYGRGHKFYRSSRAGHLVTIVPSSSVPEAELPVLAGLSERHSDNLDATLSASRPKLDERKDYERPSLRVPGQRRT